jgi:hypothetical protein
VGRGLGVSLAGSAIVNARWEAPCETTDRRPFPTPLTTPRGQSEGAALGVLAHRPALAGTDESSPERLDHRLFAEAFGANADELLHRDGTVVVLYDKRPDDAESQAVEDCR